MPQSVRQIHLAAQRRHPVAYWAAGGALVATIPLVLLDQRFGLLLMLVGAGVSALICRLGEKKP